MHKFLSILFCLTLLVGCTGMPIVFQKDDFSASKTVAEPIPLEASITNGKLKWEVKLANKTNYRGYFVGDIDVCTDKEIVSVHFSLTVNATSVVPVAGEVAVAGKEIVYKTPRISGPANTVTCTCAENCSGKKCKGVLANWPVRELLVDYKHTELKPKINVIEVTKPVEPSIEVTYDPTNAIKFNYIVFLKNTTQWEIVADISIREGDKILKEHTIGIEPFKTANREGELTFSRPAEHAFTVKVDRIHFMNKK